MEGHVPAAAHADDLQINAARRLDLALVCVQDIFFDLPQIAGGPCADDHSLAVACPPHFILIGMGGKLFDKFRLFNQNSIRYGSFKEFIPQQGKELGNHEIAVGIAVQSALLGVFSRQADVFVKVEAAHPAGVNPFAVESLGQMFVHACGRIARGQAKDAFRLARLAGLDAFFGKACGNLAHLIKIFCHVNCQHGTTNTLLDGA